MKIYQNLYLHCKSDEKECIKRSGRQKIKLTSIRVIFYFTFGMGNKRTIILNIK